MRDEFSNTKDTHGEIYKAEVYASLIFSSDMILGCPHLYDRIASKSCCWYAYDEVHYPSTVGNMNSTICLLFLQSKPST